MEDVERISIYQKPGMDYNEDRLNASVFQQYGNMIDCARDLYGFDEFQKRLNARTSKPNPKYEMIKQKHKDLPHITELDHLRNLHEKGYI